MQFDLCISESVLKEAGADNPSATALRLYALSGIAELQPAADVPVLAEDQMLEVSRQEVARRVRARIQVVCRDLGYEPCIICTPEELLED